MLGLESVLVLAREWVPGLELVLVLVSEKESGQGLVQALELVLE